MEKYLQIVNAFFAKLPFRKLAEAKVPAGAIAKFPLLGKAIPYVNQITCGLVFVLLVACIGGVSGETKTGLNGRWDSSDGGVMEFNNGNMEVLNAAGKPVFKGTYTTNGGSITTKVTHMHGGIFAGYLESKWYTKEEIKATAIEEIIDATNVYFATTTDTYSVNGNTLSWGKLTLTRKSASESQPKLAQAAPAGRANAESDFEVKLTEDGTGAVITDYVGTSKTVVIPATIQGIPVRRIAGSAFAGKILGLASVWSSKAEWLDTNVAKITSVVIPEGVASIGIKAFAYCTSLSSITLPSTLTTLEQGAIRNCEALTTLSLPAGITEMDDYTFTGSGLTSFPNTWPAAITTIPEYAFAATKMRNAVIPEGVTEIGEGTFGQCKELTSVTLPSTIRRIRWGAFGECSNLTTLNIPESAVAEIKIDRDAFASCPKLSLASQAALKRVGY